MTQDSSSGFISWKSDELIPDPKVVLLYCTRLLDLLEILCGRTCLSLATVLVAR